MTPRLARPGRLLGAALTGTVAILIAACSGAGAAGAGSSPAGPASPAGAVSPAKALTLAASQARKVTSFTATMNISASGTYPARLRGTVAEQTRPALLAQQKFAVTAAGSAVPGGIQTVLTSSAVYLKMSSLSRMLGKPWARIPFSSLKSANGMNLGPLIQQLQSDSPLSFAQMLPAASKVRKTGTATVNGVHTTEYTGTFDPAKALSRLDPGLRKQVAPALATSGVTTDRFTVWVDSQHQVRKLSLIQSGRRYRVTSVMVVTSVNQPVHIQVPSAGQAAIMPGS